MSGSIGRPGFLFNGKNTSVAGLCFSEKWKNMALVMKDTFSRDSQTASFEAPGAPTGMGSPSPNADGPASSKKKQPSGSVPVPPYSGRRGRVPSGCNPEALGRLGNPVVSSAADTGFLKAPCLGRPGGSRAPSRPLFACSVTHGGFLLVSPIKGPRDQELVPPEASTGLDPRHRMPLVVKPFGPVDLSGSLARLLGGVLPSRGPASWDELTDVTADGAHHFPPRLIHPRRGARGIANSTTVEHSC